ncbi:hypothetical protein VPHG_00156 [Vibrio phage 11895-B1]|uniref:hypothetical protein n=1 Tax=Vibrio phage 11895-B1 TaxID=754075 RepID=UPI0002C0EB64|nr:hypothetical protein VPHG_00156 [Vibrio phage 11895-B1]AGH32220.1 hypothetical protein VPHG_00156 [Vibrio phage 11895-B1]
MEDYILCAVLVMSIWLWFNILEVFWVKIPNPEDCTLGQLGWIVLSIPFSQIVCLLFKLAGN